MKIDISKIYILDQQPNFTVPNRFWYDLTNNQLKRYDSDSQSWKLTNTTPDNVILTVNSQQITLTSYLNSFYQQLLTNETNISTLSSVVSGKADSINVVDLTTDQNIDGAKQFLDDITVVSDLTGYRYYSKLKNTGQLQIGFSESGKETEGYGFKIDSSSSGVIFDFINSGQYQASGSATTYSQSDINSDSGALLMLARGNAASDEVPLLKSGRGIKVYSKSEIDANISALNSSLSSKANDSAVVHKTGDESISGNKTFNDSITVNGTIINGDGVQLANNSDRIYFGNGTYLNAMDDGTSGKDILNGSSNNAPTSRLLKSIFTNYTPTSALSANYALLSGDNTFTGSNYFKDGTIYIGQSYTDGSFIESFHLNNLGISKGENADITIDAGTNGTLKTGTLYFGSDYISGIDKESNYGDLSNPITASDYSIPSSKLVATALSSKANDTSVIHLTGNETVAGIKTFTDSIKAVDDITIPNNTTTLSDGGLVVTGSGYTTSIDYQGISLNSGRLEGILSDFTNRSSTTVVNSEATYNALELKQDKTDGTLNTTSKTIVGAINELNTKLLVDVPDPITNVFTSTSTSLTSIITDSTKANIQGKILISPNINNLGAVYVGQSITDKSTAFPLYPNQIVSFSFTDITNFKVATDVIGDKFNYVIEFGILNASVTPAEGLIIVGTDGSKYRLNPSGDTGSETFTLTKIS